MGLFGSSSPFDADIDKATSEFNTTDQWGLILEICDRVGASTVNSKECLRSVMRRLAHTDPHVVIQAITLLDACVSNCGKTFHLEVASREFENEFRRLMAKQQPQVAQKMAGLIKKWAEEEFKSDPQLNLIPSLYAKLKAEGVDFAEMDSKSSTPASKPAAPVSKDPNVVSSQQEMDDIAKAIELSLKESPMKHATTSSRTTTSSSAVSTASSSLYPMSSLAGGNFSSSSSSTTEARKVRALYDFEAAEDNELNFMAGDIIHVTDDSDPNWWKGYNQRGEGLFPASFVTADLSVEPESLRLDLHKAAGASGGGGNKKSVQFADDVKEEHVLEINEEKLDRLLHLLHEANPEEPSTDTAEMLSLERMVNQMGPLIDTELERTDRMHAQLARLSVGLVDAFNLYHTLMREAEKPVHGIGYMGYGQQPMYGHHPNMHHHPQGPPPGSMPPNMMMGPGPHNSNMFPQNQQPQQQLHQPGMPYNTVMPGMQMPPNSPHFPVGTSGVPVSSPVPLPNMSMGNQQGHPMAGMHQHQPQITQQQQHPNQMHQENNNNNNSNNNNINSQSPISHPHHQQQQQSHPHQSMMNTITSNSIPGGPITNPGQPPSQSYGPPPQQQLQSGPMSFPVGPQQQQQFNPQGVQFQQPGMTNGGSPQHAGGPSPYPQSNMGHPGHQQLPTQQSTVPMVSFNNSPMMMGGQQTGVQSMHNPGGQHPGMMGGENNMSIPIYQQQR